MILALVKKATWLGGIVAFSVEYPNAFDALLHAGGL